MRSRGAEAGALDARHVHVARQLARRHVEPAAEGSGTACAQRMRDAHRVALAPGALRRGRAPKRAKRRARRPGRASSSSSQVWKRGSSRWAGRSGDERQSGPPRAAGRKPLNWSSAVPGSAPVSGCEDVLADLEAEGAHRAVGHRVDRGTAGPGGLDQLAQLAGAAGLPATACGVRVCEQQVAPARQEQGAVVELDGEQVGRRRLVEPRTGRRGSAARARPGRSRRRRSGEHVAVDHPGVGRPDAAGGRIDQARNLRRRQPAVPAAGAVGPGGRHPAVEADAARDAADDRPADAAGAVGDHEVLRRRCRTAGRRRGPRRASARSRSPSAAGWRPRGGGRSRRGRAAGPCGPGRSPGPRSSPRPRSPPPPPPLTRIASRTFSRRRGPSGVRYVPGSRGSTSSTTRSVQSP